MAAAGHGTLPRQALRAAQRAVCVPAAAPTANRVNTVSASNPNHTQDLENTVGSWDMYGQEDKSRYNGLQSEL